MAFRAARSPVGLMRRTDKTVITTYGRDTAVASTLFYREGAPGRVGRQMQTWVRFPKDGRLSRRHVSIHRRAAGSRDMSLDDLPASVSSQGAEPTVVRRVDRPSPQRGTRSRGRRSCGCSLADEIVRGVLPPGCGARRDRISRGAFRVSRTPVREALRQLVASGLVEARAHRGAVVAQPSLGSS